jgi:hypothetical protein
MGGFNSGRRGGRPLIEKCASLAIDVAALLRGVPAWPGPGTTAAGRLTWRRYGETWASVDASATIDRSGHGALTLRYDIDHYARSTGPQEQRITLIGAPRPFGGFMWYALCPFSHRRVRKLYLPNGVALFGSRQAYGLRHDVLNEAPMDRAHRRLATLHRRLGSAYQGPDWPPPRKPRWMRWRSYERLCARIMAGEDALETAYQAGAARLLARLERHAIGTR